MVPIKKLQMIRSVLTATTMILFSFFLMFFNNCRPKTKEVISADEVFGIINDTTRAGEYLVLDTRKRMDYIRGHLVPAQWIQADSLGDKLDLLPRNASIIIYDYDNDKSISAANLLRKNGFTSCVAMQGGYAEWIKKGFPSAIRLVRNTSPTIDVTSKTITTDAVNKIIGADSTYVVIDIRSHPAFLEAHIKNALSIPYVPLNEFVISIEEQDFSRNKPIILYTDDNFANGDKAADVMLRNDYTEIYLLKGGFEEWQSKGFPTE
jgi:rhodanese-related sulfurtransferase